MGDVAIGQVEAEIWLLCHDATTLSEILESRCTCLEIDRAPNICSFSFIDLFPVS